MSHIPKTPSRRSRNDTRTPLTPSLTSRMSNLNLEAIPSPGRARRGKSASRPLFADTTNPFLTSPQKSTKTSTFSRSLSKSSSYSIAKPLSTSNGQRSRGSSPVKKLSGGGIVVTEELAREASGGMIKKLKNLESQFDILKNDYAPPPRVKMKRSKSQSDIVKVELHAHHTEYATYCTQNDRNYPRDRDVDLTDRFITNRAEQDLCATLEHMHLNVKSASPGHTSRLVKATGVPLNGRVLAYHEAPPVSSADPLLAEQREIVQPLYQQTGSGLVSSTSNSSTKSRKISTQPERVLDAPGMVDDFYLNLISWSSQNVVAVALGESTYIWRAETGGVTHIGDAPEGTHVSAVDFSGDGEFLSIGTGAGAIELWDVESGTKLRTMPGHQAQISSLSWNGHVLSSGCGDGSIWHHDVRIARHKVAELLGHVGEVCGLKWRPDGEFLASGGNDNVVNIWDGRALDSITEGEEVMVQNNAKWTKRNHTAAVKVSIYHYIHHIALFDRLI